MSENKIYRLSKLAKEFNLGTSSIAEFLAEKGVEVANSPSAKISQASYNLLLEAFKGEKVLKNKAESTTLPDLSSSHSVVIEEKETKKKKVVEESKPMLRGTKVFGKIDLDDKSKKAQKVSKPKKEVQESPDKTDKISPPATGDKKAEKLKHEVVETKIAKLSGLKAVGKIELKEEPKPKKKLVASSKIENLGENKRKKRKRVENKSFGKKEAKKKEPQKPEVSEDEIQKGFKETLSKLGDKSKSRAAKYRKEKREAVQEQLKIKEEQEQEASKTIKLTEFVTVKELASFLDTDVNNIISSCLTLGMMVSINQRLDNESISLLAEEFGFQVEFEKVEEEALEEVAIDESKLEPRPPIITVMGHVDHGKTSLLDYIRKANVIAGESGGITQHIGAYSVEAEKGKSITFLDTPGHEAFTAMRARGTQVTDIAIILVAANDGVKPQTIEAINHAKAAGVQMVVAINKIDVPEANPEKVREELSQQNIITEDWGGEYQSQEISSKTGKGVKELLEKLLLLAELKELKAVKDMSASGIIIESSLDKGRGYVATALVQQGTLKQGDIVLAGSFYGKVKYLGNERGQKIGGAIPATPVEILGLNGAPQAGDTFKVYEDERDAKSIATKRNQLLREQDIRTKKQITLEEIGRRISVGDFQELNIIIKGDVDGSIEALSDSIIKLSTKNIIINVIHKSIGQISESDVMLASASNAIIVGFQVRPSTKAREKAEQESVEIKLYSIIYDALDDIKNSIEGLMKPKEEEKVTGDIEIKEVFKISKIGSIAGCVVLSGMVSRNSKIRLIREGIVIYTGELSSLKRFKDDVKEVTKGFECGLSIKNYNDIKVEDKIETFEIVEVKQKLN